MDIKLFFNKLTDKLKLGKIIEEPTQVKGGLTHRMFKFSTDKGRFIAKLLNPNIMKRPTAMSNFNKADSYEEIIKQNNINAVYSLKFNDTKMQEIDGQYFYVYEWYDGKSLKDGEITEYHCSEMGKVLAKIHNIDLVNKDFSDNEKNIDFKYYIDLCKEKESSIYDLLYDKLDVLNDSMKKGNEAIKKLPNYYSICHNDMDPKNVMWLDNDYKIIDLECLGYSNPYLELYELALCWSGYEKCDINFDLFKTFFKSYFENTILDKNVDWESIYYANNGRLEWLEFNIKRSLMIECDTKEEQKIGLNEVKETIEHVVYYDKVKDKILNTIKELLND
ncbi:MAG: phosphotransferase [Bacilli bacterium]|nr:phosphotransferase [Bacilli bacterium]